MAALKIVFVAGDKQIVLYGQGMKQMWQVESHVLERLGEEERLRLDTAQFRKYWIDDEGDAVTIMNDVDYDFFLKRASGGNRTPKIYFEARYPEKNRQQESQASSTSSPQQDRQNLSVHSTVSCDVCNVVPVVGFRYKCLQCPNYDLCMKCEAEMKHPDHLMLRIPNSDSSILESVCPIIGSFGNRRRQRKFAAAAAAAATGAGPSGDGAQADGKFRHHRHHRRHCGTGGAGIWSNFYDMMQDLAEGGAVPQDSAATESPQRQQQQEASAPLAATEAEIAAAAATAAAASAGAAAAAATTAAANSQSKETNTSPDRSAPGVQTPPRYSASAPPSFENLQNFIDPTFMKAGIQILNNFSEMFGKILDPVATADANRPSSSPAASVVIDLTAENRASATPPPTAVGTPNAASGSKQTSPAGSGIVTPMETEVSPPATPPELIPRSRNSQSEENDWTMIDNNVATSTTAETATTDAAVAVPFPFPPSEAARMTQVLKDQRENGGLDLDYDKLNQQLKTYIENQQKGLKERAQVVTAAATAPVPPMDYAKLNQQLKSHIEDQQKMVDERAPAAEAVQATLTAIPSPIIPSIPASIPVAVPAPTVTLVSDAAPTTSDTTERRAVAVFHPDARINNAVHAMMAMGFSNEGAMLTELLESVNGSIPLALDLMSAAQQN